MSYVSTKKSPVFTASTKETTKVGRPKAAPFVLGLNKAPFLALNTTHVLRVSKADVLALNKAHVLRLNIKICPMFRANTKEAANFEMWECKSDGFEMWESKSYGVLIVLRCGSAKVVECWSF